MYLLIAFAVGLSGCQKVEETVVQQKVQEVEQYSSSTAAFETEFDELMSYLDAQNSASSGAMVTYMNNNPGFDAQDLEDQGYADFSTLEGHYLDIEAEADLINDEDDVNAAAQSVQGNYTDFNGIVILHCQGCLNRVRGDHCWTLLSTWSWGPNC